MKKQSGKSKLKKIWEITGLDNVMKQNKKSWATVQDVHRPKRNDN